MQELQRELASRYLGAYDGAPWADWLLDLLLPYFLDKAGEFTGFAEFHSELWEWVFSIEKEKAPRPFVQIVFRGGGKSTNAEAAHVYLGGEGIRRYGWYVSATQAQADDHLSNISGMMQSSAVARKYPKLAQVKLDPNGRSLGWRANRLRTAAGYTADAVGIDAIKRGGRIESARPDFITFDDIDTQEDTPKATAKKLKTISRAILPAGADNVAVLFVQNMPNPNGIAAKLVENTADMLYNRKLSGPYPAIRNMTYIEDRATGKAKITGGVPTWNGFGLDIAQQMLDLEGLPGFLVERQNNKEVGAGLFLAGIWNDSIHGIEPFEIPAGWYLDRSFDWGWEKPYGVIWWAMSDGETPADIHDRRIVFPRGSLFGIAELYGWTGKPNQGVRHSSEEIARQVKKIEREAFPGRKINPGPADSSIFDVLEGDSVADRMARLGIRWKPAVKGPGSRVQGAQKVVTMLRASIGGRAERPGIRFFRTCRNILRTFPILPKDATKDGDVDTDAEDHLWDPTRYRVYRKQAKHGRAQAAFG